MSSRKEQVITNYSKCYNPKNTAKEALPEATIWHYERSRQVKRMNYSSFYSQKMASGFTK